MPCLLDRLIDDRPHMPAEDDIHRTFSVAQLRASILRDLSWLLNTRTKLPGEYRKDFPILSRSVLNYGLDDICGRDYDNYDLKKLEQEIRSLIVMFEPRIMPDSIGVDVHRTDEDRPTSFMLEIRGTIHLLPVPEKLLVRTMVDTESGQVELVGG